MELLEKAYEFAKKAHEGQKDKAGNEYITHPLWVSNHLDDLKCKVVGLLHDTVEDSLVTLEDIEKEFGKEIKDAVDALTKRDGEDYLGYVLRASQNPISKQVKIMDIRNNMDLTRINGEPTDSDFWRLENKYKPAYRMLTGHNLLLNEQINTNLSDFEIKHLLFNLLSKRLKFERIDRNIEYILKDYSTAVSDELKTYVEGVLNGEILCD